MCFSCWFLYMFFIYFKKNHFLMCFWLLVSMCASFMYGNVFLLTKKSLFGVFYVRSFHVSYIYVKVQLSQPFRVGFSNLVWFPPLIYYYYYYYIHIFKMLQVSFVEQYNVVMFSFMFDKTFDMLRFKLIS